VTFGNYDLPFSTWVEKALVEIGINPLNGFNSGYLNGSAYQLLTIDPTEFTRVSSEVAFLRPALERPNYIVYQSTMAQKILFDSSKTATGVLVSMGKRRFTLKARKEVIVTAGVFQSPHLLMVSGVGPAAKLRRFNIPVVADRPGVGQNMWVCVNPLLFDPLLRFLC
jgi:choline dehydrogenase